MGHTPDARFLRHARNKTPHRQPLYALRPNTSAIPVLSAHFFLPLYSLSLPAADFFLLLPDRLLPLSYPSGFLPNPVPLPLYRFPDLQQPPLHQLPQPMPAHVHQSAHQIRTVHHPFAARHHPTADSGHPVLHHRLPVLPHFLPHRQRFRCPPCCQPSPH